MKTSDYPVRRRFTALLITVMFCCLLGLPAGAAEIGMGPYLQDVTRDAITIIWWTDFSAAGHTNRAEYGDGLTNFQNAVETDEPSFSSYLFHYKQEARITGLQENTAYSYRVRSDDGANVYTSRVFSFYTAPARSTNIHFAVLGDGRTDNATIVGRHKAVFSNALAHGAAFVLYGGDMVLSGSGTTPGTDQDWGIYLTNVLCTGNGQTGSGAGNRIPVYMAVGNHEIYRSGFGDGYAGGNLTSSMARFKAVCANPDNSSTNSNWKERYYAFAYGPCYFICLDANSTANPLYKNHDLLNAGDTPDWEPGSEQYQWMIGQLEYARTHAAFTFVFIHPAPYCRGVHGGPGDSQRGYELRALDPVFRSYGVDGIFCSHDHLVERCVTGPAGYHTNYPGGLANLLAWQDPSNLNYFVQGNSGQASRPAQTGWETWLDITGNDAAPFYTAYFYDWGGNDSYSSYDDVDIAYHPTNQKWRAAFSVVRTDVAGTTTTNDEFFIERADPLAAGMAVLGKDGSSVASGDGADPAKGTDFGIFTPGSSPVTNTFAVSNSGNQTLAISGVTTNGSPLFQCSSIPASIAMGTASNFAIVFNPSAAGVATASVAIANNSGVTPFILNIKGAVNGAPTNLPAPGEVSASDGAYTNKIRVTWNAVSAATRYEVWRQTRNSSVAASKISSPDPTGTSYDDATATVGINYYYWVEAVNAAGASSFSESDHGYLGVVGPLITANGLVGDVYLDSGDAVAIAVQMMHVDPYVGIQVDWWVIAFAYTGQWYYMNNVYQWTYFNGDLRSCHPVYQGPLANVASTPVLSGVLGAGTYTFWFAVDYPMDGVMNGTAMLYNSATVVVQ